MNITAIIQARMGSTRLPGKVMKILGDRTVLGHVIMRCMAIPSVNKVVVATTQLEEDAVIFQEAVKYGVSCYRGSVNHVLSRYIEAAKQSGSDVIVRFTSDCPLLDPAISDKIIRHFLDHNLDYSRMGLDTFPRGLDTEVFTMDALIQAFKHASNDYDYEHVTPYIYQHPDQFNMYVYQNEENHSRYRLTLDTPEDWALISAIYKELYKGDIFNWEDVRELLQLRPELSEINEVVKQKKLGE